MKRQFSVLVLTVATLSLGGCWPFDDPDDNPCVQKGQVCCVVDTGPTTNVQMCKPTAEACLAERPATAVGPYPRPHTDRSTNMCK